MQARVAMPAANMWLCGSKWTCSACVCPLPPRRDGRLYLRVDWTAQQLERFDLAAWLTPAVHESASPEAMQPTLDIIKVRASGLLVSNVEVAQAAVHACIKPGASSWRAGGSQAMPHSHCSFNPLGLPPGQRRVGGQEGARQAAALDDAG